MDLTVFYFYVKYNFLDVSVGAAVYNFCDWNAPFQICICQT